jgi:hypothetical protein
MASRRLRRYKQVAITQPASYCAAAWIQPFTPNHQAMTPAIRTDFPAIPWLTSNNESDKAYL